MTQDWLARLVMAECAITFPPYKKIMPNYVRYRIKAGCYFFTVNLLERNRSLLVDYIDLLRDSVRLCKQKRLFNIDAWVVLPKRVHPIYEGATKFLVSIETPN